MLLAFESRELRTRCEHPPALWPSELDRDLLIDRLADILAAESLAELPVGVVWDEITPRRVIIEVSPTCRFVCRTNHVAVRRTPEGAPDWTATNRLYVERVEVDGRTS